MVNRGRRLGRMTVGAGTLVLLALVLQVTTAAPAAAAAISVSPSSGPAGSSAVIEGGDFIPVVAVELCWGADNCSNLGTASPSLTGDLRATITIPAGAGPGTYSISACQPASGCANASFEVTAEDTTTTSSSVTTSTTVPSTTTSTGASVTTSLVPTTTSTRLQPTVTRAPSSPTTTSPGPTTTSPGAGTTSPAPPGSAPTTTSADAVTTSTADSSTTTLASAIATETTRPPFVLDLGALFTDTTVPAPVEDGAATDSVLGATALPASPLAGQTAGGFNLPLDDKTPRAGPPLSGFGMWAGWLLLVFGAAATSIAVDELRRRRG